MTASDVAELSSADQRLVHRARNSLRDAWAGPGIYENVIEILETLIEGSIGIAFSWKANGRFPQPVALARPDWIQQFSKTPWVAQGVMLEARMYGDPKQAPYRPGRPVSLADLERECPKKAVIAREALFEPLAMADQLRLLIGHGSSRPPAVIVLARLACDGRFTARHRRFMQCCTATINDIITARRLIDRDARSNAGLIDLIDAVDQPVFVLSPGGNVVHANTVAAHAYDATPAWVTCADFKSRAMRRVDLPVDGTTLKFLFVDPLSVDVDEAPDSVWARRWRLPPRLARVAACILRGMSDKEIATRLGISHHTARTYVRNLLQAVGISSRGELAVAARRLTATRF